MPRKLTMTRPLESVDAFEARGFDRFLGTCVDSAPLRQDAGLLAAEGQATAPVRQRFHSHLLRSQYRTQLLNNVYRRSGHTELHKDNGRNVTICAPRLDTKSQSR